MKEIKYVTNRNLLGSLIGSQSLKNIDMNVYFGGPLDNPEGIDGFPFTGEGIECYYMMLRCKLKTLTDLKRKIMDELKLNLLGMTSRLFIVTHTKSFMNG